MTRRALLSAGVAGIAGAIVADTDAASAKPEASPWCVFDCAARKDITWEDLGERLASAQVVFAGEFHDDPETHQGELALLHLLHDSWKGSLTLAMEMLERDGQEALDSYLAGKTDEATFSHAVSLWPNYATDYRPMVEYARENKIPMLGSNAPGRIVKRVGREGAAAVLPSLTPAERAWVAESLIAPEGDAYAKRFAEAMGGTHGESHMDAAMVRRFYEAQCLRDDTMAQTIARALAAGRRVLHINGGFHSDAGLGTVQRLLWRRPLRAPQVALVKFVPVKGDLSDADTASVIEEANFAVFVPDHRVDKGNIRT